MTPRRCGQCGDMPCPTCGGCVGVSCDCDLDDDDPMSGDTRSDEHP